MNKQDDFMDLSISGIHIMRFNAKTLQEMVASHRYRPIAIGGVEQYNAPKDQPFDKWADLWSNQEQRYLRRRI